MKKNILAENMRRFKTKNLNEKTWEPGLGKSVLDTGGMSGHQGSGISDGDKMMQRLHGDQKWDINVNYYEYDTNFSSVGPVTINKPLDEFTLEGILEDIEEEIKSSNQDMYIGPVVDLARLISDITLDCEIKIGKDEIDLTITFEVDGGIKRIDIHDEPLAEKYGITDDSIIKHLDAEGI